MATIQPKLADHDKALFNIQSKIKQLETKLIAAKEDEEELKEKVRYQLNVQSQALHTLRMKQAELLDTQWAAYTNEQKESRRKEIEKRQVEFDKELNELDVERRKKWVSQERTPVEQSVLNDLMEELKHQRNHNGAVVTLAMHWVDLLWQLNIDVPVLKSEITTTMMAVENRKT